MHQELKEMLEKHRWQNEAWLRARAEENDRERREICRLRVSQSNTQTPPAWEGGPPWLYTQLSAFWLNNYLQMKGFPFHFLVLWWTLPYSRCVSHRLVLCVYFCGQEEVLQDQERLKEEQDSVQKRSQHLLSIMQQFKGM